MMEDFIGTYGNNLIVAVVGVGVALLALAIILWIIRRRGGSSPFIRGGKSRQPRLQVLDAAAVDARRRLVLVRRDNVEHLVMIGGPTDIVIESGIGAIPFMKDVREPQSDMLPPPPAEKPIAPSRAQALPANRQEENRPTTPVAAATTAPVQTQRSEPRPAPVAAQPTPAVRPAPTPAPAPRPAAPAPQPVVTPEPFVAPQPAAASQPVTPPPPVVVAPPVVAPRPASSPVHAPRVIAKEPVAPAMAAAVIPAAAVISLNEESSLKELPFSQDAPEVAPVVTPEPELGKPGIDHGSAGDFLDAARDRVLPTFATAAPIAATAAVAKPEPLAPADNGPVFGDQLTSDFESFLEAEIAKNNNAASPDITSDIDIAPTRQPEAPQTVSPPVSDGTADSEVQKEMARIFGEMAVTRDK